MGQVVMVDGHGGRPSTRTDAPSRLVGECAGGKAWNVERAPGSGMKQWKGEKPSAESSRERIDGGQHLVRQNFDVLR